jgi:hypothetical protein
MKRMVLGSLAMTHMTRWIDEAEAREMVQSAMVDHTVRVTQNQYLHLGSTIAKVSSWWHHNISRDVLPCMCDANAATCH